MRVFQREMRVEILETRPPVIICFSSISTPGLPSTGTWFVEEPKDWCNLIRTYILLCVCVWEGD